MGQSTIQRSGIYLISLCVASHGFPLLEDLPEGGNDLDAQLPSVPVVSDDALLQSKYNIPVVHIALSPPTMEYQSPIVQELLPPQHNFQRLPVSELRPPTVEYQPPVGKINWKKRIHVFPEAATPLKMPLGSKGAASKAVTSMAAGVGAASPWWVSVPMVDRHLQPPTENFYYTG